MQIIEVAGYRIDLDLLYREMWNRGDPEPGGTRVFRGSGGSDRRRPVKRLLNDLFGVPVEDDWLAVNDECRRAATVALDGLGWARKVDRNGELLADPIGRSPSYRLFRLVDGEDVPPRRNPDWARDEIILALDVYVREGSVGGGALPTKHSAVAARLSAELQALPLHAPAERGPRFRNPEGVCLKLANFRAVEHDFAVENRLPGASALPTGMPAYSRLDRPVFEEFYGDWERLHAEAEAIRAAHSKQAEFKDEPGVAQTREIDVQAVAAGTYEAAGAVGGLRRRNESLLVQDYAEHMRSRGHKVSAREYLRPQEARPLRCDVFIDDLNVLVEAKRSDSRDNIRYAIGQLYDYRRGHEVPPTLAVLLPHQPRADLRELLAEAGIHVIWHDGRRFRDSDKGRLST